MKQTMEIRTELPSLNEIIASSKTHWSKYASPKKGYTAIVAAHAKQQLKPVKRQVDIHCHWICRNKRKDKDNIASGGLKFILDGLVKGKILPNDNWKWVGNISHSFEADKQNVGVVVTIFSL